MSKSEKEQNQPEPGKPSDIALKLSVGQIVSPEVPKPTKKDYAAGVVRVIAQDLPIINTVVGIYDVIFQPALTKRQDKWLEALRGGLVLLQERVDNLDAKMLAQNESFISTALQASAIAMRTHQKEKLEALRNAVLNSALPSAPDENLQLMFLSLIDRFSSWHIAILKLFSDDQRIFELTGFSNLAPTFPDLENVLEAAYPELANQIEYYHQVVKEITDCGLVIHKPISIALVEAQAKYGKQGFHSLERFFLTSLGSQFLEYIMSPIDEAKPEQA